VRNKSLSMKHSLSLLLIFCFLVSCRSLDNDKPKFRSRGKSYSRFTGKINNKPLAIESDWVGGSRQNPVYYTAVGERIYTLDKDVYVYPVTTRSINSRGQVVYPSSGYQLIGDMKLTDFTQLIVHIHKSFTSYKKHMPLQVEADSNFLERPAQIFDKKTGASLGRFQYTLGRWRRLD
jgi:hypothetical protein